MNSIKNIKKYGIIALIILLLIVAITIFVFLNSKEENKEVVPDNLISVIVYLEKGLTDTDINNIKKQIESQENVVEIEFKSKEQWKDEMSEYDDTFETIINNIDENLLSDSFIIKINDEARLSEIEKYISNINGVTSLRY